MAKLKDKLYDCFKHWADKGDVWVISDTHFGASFDECGFEWKPSDEDIVRFINSCVAKHDTLIMLGDVGDIESVKKLKGYKVLITGNHDRGNTYYKRKQEYIEIPGDWTLEQIRDKYSDFKSFVPNTEKRTIYVDNNLFDEIYNGPLFINNKILLSHEPIIDTDGCFYNIHGHKHNDNIIRTPYSFNVCSNAIHFTPVKLLTLLQGDASKIKDIHRFIVDNAIERKKLKQENDNN